MEFQLIRLHQQTTKNGRQVKETQGYNQIYIYFFYSSSLTTKLCTKKTKGREMIGKENKSHQSNTVIIHDSYSYFIVYEQALIDDDDMRWI